MDWFDAMQCCYFQNSYLAEPLSQAEMDVLRNYMMICKLYTIYCDFDLPTYVYGSVRNCKLSVFYCCIHIFGSGK